MSPSLDGAMEAFAPALPLAVGYSGGADSSALLVACAKKWPGQVRAIHIHHGLQAAADHFEWHCRKVCAELGVPLLVLHVDASSAPGESPEAAARAARYAAFTQATKPAAWPDVALEPIKTIAIAQHADDQVETVLLALSRGAGLAGIAGMPARWSRDGIAYARPLLAVSAAEIRRWLAERSIAFLEDPSNQDMRFTRNRIRHQLLPMLEATFPHFRQTFARSAAHAAQGSALLDELAQLDLLVVGQPPRIDALHGLPLARRSNALRYWLKSHHAVIPSAAQLQELLRQLDACRTRGHRIHLRVGQGFVRREGEKLAWYNL